MIRRYALFSVVCVVSCAGEPAVENKPLTAADDQRAPAPAPSLQDKLVVGAVLETTVDVNLRDAPGAQTLVLRVVPTGSRVVVTASAQMKSNYLYVRHDGLIGWMNAGYLRFVSAPDHPVELPTDVEPDAPAPAPAATGDNGTLTPTPTPTPTEPSPIPVPQQSAREAAIARAQTGVGYSYWWGGGRWDPSGATPANKGTCSGVCPNCTHGGSFGADCSGFVDKVWQVPDSNDNPLIGSHPYSTYNFTYESTEWGTVDRDTMQMADAFVYNTNGSGHILLYEQGDQWGQFWSYESRGCATGVVHNLRSVTTTYKSIQRDGY